MSEETLGVRDGIISSHVAQPRVRRVFKVIRDKYILLTLTFS